MDKIFNIDQKLKLTQLISEGITVLSEVETLQGGLKDTIRAIAEELEIKPSILSKALRLAFKSGFTQEQNEHELLENILTTVGRTLWP